MDGAGEWTMFWNITMSLSKPILAVIALSAFTAAYSNFMFALLLCQDEKMWTIMVWLYQLQMNSGQGVIFASLLLAALPTFLGLRLLPKHHHAWYRGTFREIVRATIFRSMESFQQDFPHDGNLLNP